MFNKKKNNYYFDSFPKLAHYPVVCGEMILEFLKKFYPKHEGEVKDRVHLAEHEADNLKHEVTEKLLKEFMTPIDREDIYELLRLIDNVTDSIEEISLRLFLYNVQEVPDKFIELTEVTVECMKETEYCLSHIYDYLNEDVFKPLVDSVVKLEEKSDEIYISAVHELYGKEKDFRRLYVHEKLYELMEDVSDKCREVCRFVQNIALKNI